MKRWTASDVLFPVVLLACGVLVVIGLVLALSDPSADRRLVGAALLAAGVVGAICSALAFGVYSAIRHQRETTVRLQEQTLATVSDRLSAISVLLNVVTEQQLISDRAKALAYREKDRETLRRAIREEMGRGDWEAARALVDEMDRIFGYRAEAERFRSEVGAARDEQSRQRMVESQDRIERLCRAEDWAGAQAEASRFIAEHPEYAPARRLPGEVDARRQAYKKQLLDRWNECVLRHDGDSGIEVLRMLDPYLSPAEAERMAESARSIFNDRKAKLRDQFTAAVTSRDWAQAIRIGEAIQREFPNAKFAQEVHDTMDALRARAAEQRPAEPVAAKV